MQETPLCETAGVFCFWSQYLPLQAHSHLYFPREEWEMTLRDARIAAGFTAESAAKALHISTGYYRIVERHGRAGERLNRRAATLFRVSSHFPTIQPWPGKVGTRESRQFQRRASRAKASLFPVTDSETAPDANGSATA